MVNTDQSIDIDRENRIRELAIPGGIPNFTRIPVEISELTGDLFAIATRVYERDELGVIHPSNQTQVSLISVSEAKVVSDVMISADAAAIFVAGNQEPFLLDLGFQQVFNREQQFSILEVSGARELDAVGEIEFVGGAELDANAERLMVRQLDQFVEFDGDDYVNPNTRPTGDALPAPVAVDDTFEQNVEWRYPYLNVLDNDVFETPSWVAPPKIAELIDAPEGISITELGQLHLSQDLLSSEGEYQFSYVVQQSRLQSAAQISLRLFRYSDDDVAEVRNRVIRQAAEDLGIEIADISVGRVVPYTDVENATRVREWSGKSIGRTIWCRRWSEHRWRNYPLRRRL